MIKPDSILGMLGGGQLGRMFALAAAQMGYRVWVYDPSEHSPAGEVAARHICADYDDQQALREFGQACQVVTTEFENIPAETLRFLQDYCQVCPNPESVYIAQNRIREKQFINDLGIPTSAFIAVNCAEDLLQASQLQWPCILKTAQFGYDGKGQAVVNNMQEAQLAYTRFNQVACILEQKVALETEISVVLGRNCHDEVGYFPSARNEHKNGILHISSVPAQVSDDIQTYACEIALKIAQQLDYVGILTVEYFIDDEQRLLVNEIAPRVHNSGHYSMDACNVSQFEQQVRMMCGLTPADTLNHSAVAMVNILGDAWINGELPVAELLQDVNVKLHLYGKQDAKPGRKMGHFNVLADDVADAITHAQQVYKKLMSP
ncbi:MAG: 5-(carboxyamino)imidazole ribonucleotide synthase [Candidatus Thioglobus sp.]|nr:MAG: 5-(carboxyamino)imidazole ribonucleotide synthase [Candidatus Thioglobus sp.]